MKGTYKNDEKLQESSNYETSNNLPSKTTNMHISDLFQKGEETVANLKKNQNNKYSKSNINLPKELQPPKLFFSYDPGSRFYLGTYISDLQTYLKGQFGQFPISYRALSNYTSKRLYKI